MEELKNYQEARRYKAVDALFKPTYTWYDTRADKEGMIPDEPIKLNYFEFQYKGYEGSDDIIAWYQKEEAICRDFLEGKIDFLGLLFKLETFYTLQTIVLNLEYSLPWEVINYGK